jgi:hypothetical protein
MAGLLAMLGGHITELFDHWDHTLRTGNEADYTVVFVAACLSVALTIVWDLVSAVRRRSMARRAPIPPWPAPIRAVTATESLATGPSPPLTIPIRI